MLSGPPMLCGPYCVATIRGHRDLAPCQSMDQDPEVMTLSVPFWDLWIHVSTATEAEMLTQDSQI